jgi:hypothetical protein
MIRNTGKQAATVQVTAALHETYHDDGRAQCEKMLKPGQQESPMQRYRVSR